jgi:predicted nucleic acid-binding protein
VYVDTTGWLAALHARFEHHLTALETFTSLQEDAVPLVTTSLVVAELHAMLATRVGATQALQTLDHAYTEPSFRVVHVDADLQRAAVDRWLRVYRGVPFSLCDAVSFELMRQEGLRQAFTLDVHFALAGYAMLPVMKKVRRRK